MCAYFGVPQPACSYDHPVRQRQEDFSICLPSVSGLHSTGQVLPRRQKREGQSLSSSKSEEVTGTCGEMSFFLCKERVGEVVPPVARGFLE